MAVEPSAAAGIVQPRVILTTALLQRAQQRAWENQPRWRKHEIPKPSELLFIIQPQYSNSSKSIQLLFIIFTMLRIQARYPPIIQQTNTNMVL